MKLQVSFGLECGHIIKEDMEYFWNDNDQAKSQVEASRYDSFISFNRPGNMLFCLQDNNQYRIKRISIYVVEFDVGDII